MAGIDPKKSTAEEEQIIESQINSADNAKGNCVPVAIYHVMMTWLQLRVIFYHPFGSPFLQTMCVG